MNQPDSIQGMSHSNLASMKKLSVPDLLDKLFNKYDQNSDGRLSKLQFTQIIRVLSKVTGATFPNRQDIEDLFNFIDTDGDQTVSKTEYKELTKKLSQLFETCNIVIRCKAKK